MYPRLTFCRTNFNLPPQTTAVDKLPNGADLHNSLKETTGQKTVPYVFINGGLAGCTAQASLLCLAAGRLHDDLITGMIWSSGRLHDHAPRTTYSTTLHTHG